MMHPFKENELKPYFQVKFQDGSVFEVPTIIVAQDRAAYYHERDKDEFPTLDDALKDTTELFASDTYEIEDWAHNNMNWDELAPHARLVSHDPAERDWANSELSFHDARAETAQASDETPIMGLPMELALARMGAGGNVCNVLQIGDAEGDAPIAAVALIQGGPQAVGYFVGGLQRLTDSFADVLARIGQQKPAAETTNPQPEQ